MIWSPVKQTVLAFERNLVVSAGAGSGKTAVLVELYLRLLAGETSLPQPLSVEEIAAITFTDKAAVEMKERVRQGIRSRIGRGDQTADWHALLRTLPRAVISTFHSLCSRILRENPAEAEVDPSFLLLDELSSQAELDAALDELLENELRGRSTEIRLLLRHFPLSGAGRGKGVREHLADLVRGMSGTAEADTLFAKANARWEELARQIFDEKVRELADLADEMERILGGKRLSFHEKLEQLHRLVTRERLTPGDEGTALLLDTMGQCVAGNWGKEKEVKDRLLQCLDTLQDCCWQLRSSPVATALLQLASRLAEQYAVRKERRGALDFDDLQLKARNLLLRNPAIRSEYRTRFPVLMVDEFQDTNRLQKELVELLCGEGQRLFVVGDPKQSIYLFRGAEVAVFGEIQVEVAAAGGSTLYFQESFRSREGITRFVNRLFSEVVMTGGSAGDAPYLEGDHLVPHRRDWDGSPCVELLQLDDAGSSAELRCSEAAVIARKIVGITSGTGGVTVFDKSSPESGRTPRYGDIAILFRRFSNLKQFERELRRHGIPYYVVKGKGFYRCQEILDIINFLACLESRQELIPLAGVLRSPLCGISDETLYILSTVAGGLVNWQQASADPQIWRKIRDDDRERLCSLSLLMDRLRPLRDRLTLPELLEEILIGTDFTSTLLTTFQGEQKAANLRKLIELSRSFTDGGNGSLHRFIAWLKQLVVKEPTEAEAVVSAEGENVVRLMTVHQSKGLEFPVVFIPELGAGSPVRNSPVACDDRLGIGLRLALPGGESRPSLAFREISAVRKAKEAAELKRLLYVAVTRARDYLVLTGEGKGEWRAWIDSFCAGESRDCITGTPISPATTSDAEAHGTGRPATPVSPEAMALGVQRALTYRPPLPTVMTFSPTALEDYLNCPRKYYYKRVIGLDEGLFNQLLFPRETAKRGTAIGMSALDKGNLAHAILEELDFAAEPAARYELCRTMCGRLAAHQAAKDIDEVMERVLSFAESDRGRELAGARLLRELPFTLKLDGEATYYIKGAMDLVAETPAGIAVYDYKFVEKERADLESYRFQLRVYMLALSLAYPGTRVEGALLFLKGNDEEPVKLDADACMSLLLRTMDSIRRRQGDEGLSLRESCDGSHCPFGAICKPLPLLNASGL